MMQAIFLEKFGDADKVFQQREVPVPVPKDLEVLIKVEGFGLNFADVMARRGVYQDCPPRPAILGYDVCGIIESCGKSVKHLKPATALRP